MAFLVLCAGMHQAAAQPQLNFKRVVNNWPTIDLYFSAACNGRPAYFTDKRNFTVYESGVQIDEFELWCPVWTMRCAISVALVFDASGSMQGAGNSGAKAAGMAFVDQMDGLTDEGAILWFNTSVTVAQGMTTSKTLLRSAINSLPASGNTALWDGIYEGLLELVYNGVDQCRAVICLTDGGDNSSSHSPEDVIALANRNRIRVFMIGLGGAIPSSQLQVVADLTGGRYYETPNAAQLVAIYLEISTIIFQGFQECLITYQATCADGNIRKVDLTLSNFCNGSDTKTKTYRAPRDTTTFAPMTIALAKREARGNAVVKIPLELVDPPMPAQSALYPATFSILYDGSCMQFVDIRTPSGSLLENIPIAVTPTPGGVTFTTTQQAVLRVPAVPATFAELSFKAADPEGTDTVCCPITLASWTFDAGCWRPVLRNGEICIIPRRPVIDCAIQAPQQLRWNQTDYTPNPFTVSMTLNNTGDREARTARFRIEYDKSDLSLVTPISDVQPGTPRDVQPAGSSSAQWIVTAKNQKSGDSVRVCIAAAFDNADTARCCTKIWVPPSDAVLRCDMTAPAITADSATQTYSPMPFDVTVTVRNEGVKPTDTVYARIIVPPDLKLSGPDAPDRNTKPVLPEILAPGQTGVVSWTLHHPVTPVRKEYMVGVWVKTTNADSSYCEVKIAIPPLDAPVLSPGCTAPDSLHFDDATDRYVPVPFRVALTCVNRGVLPATNVTGFLYLPGNASLANPMDSLRKAFPSPMTGYQGGPMPQVTWDIQYAKKLRYDSYLDFRFVVGGVGPGGMPTDSVETWCRVRVPGVPPAYACSITMPDSLGLNAQETDVTPNPFTITYTVWNTSRQTGMIDVVDLDFPPGDDLTLDTITPKTRSIKQTLNPGDTAAVTWIMHVRNRTTRRYEHITGTAVDDEGRPTGCGDDLPIASLKTLGIDRFGPRADAGFDLAQNTPNPFSPATTIEYRLGAETDVTLKVFDRLGREVATLVHAHQKAGAYSVIFDAGGLASGTYVYRLVTPRFTRSMRMVLAR